MASVVRSSELEQQGKEIPHDPCTLPSQPSSTDQVPHPLLVSSQMDLQDGEDVRPGHKLQCDQEEPRLVLPVSTGCVQSKNIVLGREYVKGWSHNRQLRSDCDLLLTLELEDWPQATSCRVTRERQWPAEQVSSSNIPCTCLNQCDT